MKMCCSWWWQDLQLSKHEDAWAAWVQQNVRTALNGTEALNILNDYSPDVILLDLDMPVMNGFGFLEAFEK